jgi:hypothetical protein
VTTYGRELSLAAVAAKRTGSLPSRVTGGARDVGANDIGRTATIQFYGATNGSVRNLVIVSSARASFNWLKQNLANDGNPAWDTNRTTKPSDVPVISPSNEVTARAT